MIRIKITILILLLICNFLIIQASVSAQETKVIEVPFVAEKPIVLTNPGQSPEYAVIVLLSQRINLQIEVNFHLEASDLEGFKTLIMIIGGSGKGMGAAGVNIDQEISRANKLLDYAHTHGIKVIGMHLGGSDRRGPNSDIMINTITPGCDYVIIRADGNYDGIFSKICQENEIPLTEIEKSLELLDYLKAIFNLEDQN